MSIYKGEKLISGSASASASASAYPRPDWTHSVDINVEAAYIEGYTAPSNGMIVGWFHCNASGHLIEMEINHQTIIARARTLSNGNTSWDGNVQCPVNKGDLIKLEATPSISSNEVTGWLTFVPFIDSYTGN